MTTTSDEFFTPPDEIEFVREFLGYIDLDPASCEEANKIVKARRCYTKEDNGLVLPWVGKVFCNPPYSRESISNFANRFLHERGRMQEGVLLVNSNTSSSWFQTLMTKADAVCFCGSTTRFSSRISFVGGPHGARAASAYFYCGSDSWGFCRHFSARGHVIKL